MVVSSLEALIVGPPEVLCVVEVIGGSFETLPVREAMIVSSLDTIIIDPPEVLCVGEIIGD